MTSGDGLADDLFCRQPEHLNQGRVHKNVTQIAAQPCKHDRRVGDMLELGLFRMQRFFGLLVCHRKIS